MGRVVTVQGVSGFLKRSTHEAAFGDSAALKVGMVTEVAITSVTDRRLLHVTSEQAAVSGAVVKEWEGLDIGALDHQSERPWSDGRERPCVMHSKACHLFLAPLPLMYLLHHLV